MAMLQPMDQFEVTALKLYYTIKDKGKVFPLQARLWPEGG